MSDVNDQKATSTPAEQNAIKAMRTSVEKQHSKSIFACGGKVPVRSQEEQEKGSHKAVASLPVDLRWDALTAVPDGSEEGTATNDVSSKKTKLVLPLEPSTEGNLDQLVADTQPATFGLGGEHVYDENYRKATKMDPTQFSTSFNPYTLGIIDEIAQGLLPSTKKLEDARSVRAELYKLNIYSGPSGKFKAHVDTPRAEDQFGSLVVCLPFEHEGGALEVRHKGSSIMFDWGKEGKAEEGAFIRWAAFYSDCEHEVFEVTSGHRLTLTYNLYAVRGNGLLAGYCQTLDVTQLPLYKQVVDTMKGDTFMEDGGALGFYCQHAYPHSSKASGLPATLKGVDMMLYETFRVLGYKTHLRPVVHDEWAKERFGVSRRHIGNSLDFHVDNGFEIETYGRFEELMDEFRSGGRRGGGKVFRGSQIVWASKPPKHQEPQVVYIAYGNEPSANILYSHCAIIVEVPAWTERETTAAISEQH